MQCPLWVISRHCGTSEQCPLFTQKRTLRRATGTSRFVPAATWTVIFAITVGGVEHETEHTGPLARAAPRNRRVPARTKFPTTRPCAPPWLVARNYDPKSDHVSPSSLSQGAFSVALSTGLAALDTRNAEKHNEPAPSHSITSSVRSRNDSGMAM